MRKKTKDRVLQKKVAKYTDKGVPVVVARVFVAALENKKASEAITDYNEDLAQNAFLMDIKGVGANHFEALTKTTSDQGL